VIKAFLMEVNQTRRPDEALRQPTWFSPDEAKRRLAKGREVKYARELEAAIDRALDRIHFHSALLGTDPGSRHARAAAQSSTLPPTCTPSLPRFCETITSSS